MLLLGVSKYDITYGKVSLCLGYGEANRSGTPGTDAVIRYFADRTLKLGIRGSRAVCTR